MDNLIFDTSTERVAQRVTLQRDTFRQLFESRYVEMLPLLINYKGIEKMPISPISVETILRQGLGVAIGLTQDGNMGVLGYVNRNNVSQFDGFSSFVTTPLTGGDINFLISKKLRLPKYQEITYHDNYKSGNFVVLYNKPVNLFSDYKIISLYADRIAEIAMSRFSIYMQAKVSHVVKGEADDEDVEAISNDLLNGKPYIKATNYFDEDNIVQINTVSDVVNALPELKREFQNNIAELNNLLGLNSLGVDKEAGVSNIEAQSNQSFKKSNESLYLKARNEPLRHLNRKYGTNIQAEYNDLMVSELSSLERIGLNETNN